MSAFADFRAWGCDMRVVVSERDALAEAVRLVRSLLNDVDERISPCRRDTVLARAEASGRLVDPDQLTRGLLAVAASAALASGGRTTPFAPLWPGQTTPPAASLVVPDAGDVTWPAGARLDLGATGKAFTADAAAAAIAGELGCGVLVSLGGDLATAGGADGPGTGWEVAVRDGEEPESRIHLEDGWAVATSSTRRRAFRPAPSLGSHIIDPATGLPAPAVWASVSVGAPSCAEANALSTAAIVAGENAPAFLKAGGRPARLVRADLTVLSVGGWPVEAMA
ncbi:MAG: FAD:protein FMN transferase [Arthrobacter sp.]|jgi:thiamine biosynthesis lipoprotein|nr:FAD:protein FMN transferase [Arthrobacter sp.]